MFYQKIKPSAFLSPYVECYYIWESPVLLGSPLSVESPPSGFTSMVFNYGTQYKILNRKYKHELTPKAFISGQSTEKYRLSLSGQLGMIGVVFKPAALNTLFGIPMEEIANARIEISDILGNEGSNLYNQLLERATVRQKVDVLEQFLSHKATRSKYDYDRTDFVCQQIFEKKGLVSLSAIQDDLYICKRQFQRQFLKKVGVSPKYFARISRISSLCALMARKNWKIEDWQDIIVRYGYYDQSHFIREFTEFMGEVPSMYVKNNTELANYLH